MKSKLSDVLSYALSDLGVDVITCVPGFGVSETLESISSITNKPHAFSFHEEVAYTICHGASITGKRSACLMKSQGLAKAANSVTDSLYTKITAGFVTFIFEDKTGSHSDNILETENMLSGFGFQFLKASKNKLYEVIIRAYTESELKRMPIAVLIDADEVEEIVEFNRIEHLKKQFVYTRDILSHVVHPLFAEYQYKVFKSHKSGDSTQLIKRPVIPIYPVMLSEKQLNAAKTYEEFFNEFKYFKGDIVTGDTSSSSIFSLPPFNSIDIITYIGGSIPLAIGAYMAGNKNVWAISGDFGFISAGHLGLIEAANREIPIKIVIFNNKKAEATGGQQIQRMNLVRLISPFENKTIHISNNNDPFEINEVLKEVSGSNELRIIVVDC